MRLRFIVVLFSILATFGCRGRSTPPPHSTAPAASTSAPNTSTAAAPQAVDVAIQRADGSELATISRQGGTISIAFTADGERRTIKGTLRESGKRKYQLANGPAMFEVKYGDNGFKLRRADGKLLWKVKIDGKKVKISDNEENANPYVLKLEEPARTKVQAPGDKELGSARASEEAVEVENASKQTLFKIDHQRSSAPFGVLLLDSIPATNQYILVAELLNREAP